MGVNPFPGPLPCPIDVLIKERLSSKWTSGYYPDVDRNDSILMLVSPACINPTSPQARCSMPDLCMAQIRRGMYELHKSPCMQARMACGHSSSELHAVPACLTPELADLA